MIQQGLVQIILGVLFSLLALAIVLERQAWNWIERLIIGGTRAEIALSFVLVLNRLKILMGVRYSDNVHKVMIVVIWLCVIGYQTVIYTPLVSFHSTRPHVLPRYDYSVSLSYIVFRIGSYWLLVFALLSLFVYIIIVIHLLRQQYKMYILKVQNIGSLKERPVLIYACGKFCGDFTVALLYHFGDGFLPKELWVEHVILYCYSINYVVLSPLLCICTSSVVRKRMFGRSNNYQVTIVVSSTHQSSVVKV
uniref:7TM_GPCR_Srx domain-containing protein n=1 Tax=Steinernema glaseri TaxID=37863 RepID=A0A1I7YTG1_9BILA